MAAAAATLDLVLPPEDAARLTRLPMVVAMRQGRARSMAVELVWHDGEDGGLAAAGLAICERRVSRVRDWCLTRLHPAAPGMAPETLATAEAPDAMRHPLPAHLLPVAACAGRLQTLALGDIELRLLEGRVRAAAGEHPICRVALHGPPAACEALALALIAELPLAAAPDALAVAALKVAGRAVPPPTPPMPTVSQPVGETFAGIVGRLALVLLARAPDAGDGPEPVHDMRVALRRLRSAIRLFRRVLDGPALAALRPGMAALSQHLGPARDWDVFIAGTGQAVAAAFPDDPAVARLLAATLRRRLQSYAALRTYLDGAGFRALMLCLGCLAAHRPWEQEAPAEDEVAAKRAAFLAGPLEAFAAHSLSRQFAHVLRAGNDLSGLSAEALHALRIEAKRLRYTAEFFAPLYPPREARRFVRRVSVMQDRLGRINDANVAANLLASLGGAGQGHAGGIVRGFVAAADPDLRRWIDRAWRKLRRQEPFWG